MDRRQALKTATLIVGGTFLAANGVLTGCATRAERKPSKALDADDEALIEEIGDTLLPTTAASPGAKLARVGAGVNLILTDCYKADDQDRMVQGLRDFRDTCQERKKSTFVALSRAEREDFLRGVARDAQKVGNRHYFALMRELIEGAYFSSEIGVTKARRYIMVPGRFDGCVDLVPGQPLWA